jgi:hypothetical protein
MTSLDKGKWQVRKKFIEVKKDGAPMLVGLRKTEP